MADETLDDALAGGQALERSFEALRRSSREFSKGFAFDLGAATREMERAESRSRSLSTSIGGNLRSAFDKAVFGGGKLKDVLSGLATDVSRTVLNASLKPVQNAIGSGVSSLFGQVGPSLLGGLFGFANGGAFSGGRVRAFAKGGVVGGPTTFPMRGGTGLMGEAGPEAIMPLTRGADGRLGVAAAGGGGGGVSVVVNIAARDAESFRRSQTQVSAQIARAVQRGQRNM